MSSVRFEYEVACTDGARCSAASLESAIELAERFDRSTASEGGCTGPHRIFERVVDTGDWYRLPAPASLLESAPRPLVVKED